MHVGERYRVDVHPLGPKRSASAFAALQETQRQDRDALLQPEARTHDHNSAQDEQSDVGQPYQPPEPTAEKAPQVPAAAITPASQSGPDASGSAAGGPEPNGEEKEKPAGHPQAALAAAASRTSPPPTTTDATSAKPPASVPAPGAAPAAAPAPAPPPAPVDEDYLKSLIDQELGPPKFEVPKQPAPEAAGSRGANPEATRDQQLRGDTRISLEELLEQEFGPPKFAVPKAASPKAPPAAGATVGCDSDAGADEVPVPGSAGAGGSSSSTKAKKPPVGGGRDPAKRAAALIAAGQRAAAAAATAAGSGNGAAAAGGADAGGVEGAGAGAGGPSLGRVSWSGTKRPQEALRGEGAAAGEEGAGAGGAGAGGGGLAVLTLAVTQGPEAGKRFVADDPSTEVGCAGGRRKTREAV